MCVFYEMTIGCKYFSQQLCTDEISAPEVVNAKPYGHATDWWSLGILAFVLLSGKVSLAI